MGRLGIIFLLAVAMASLACAFDAGAYLYDGETTSMVTQSDLNSSGGVYTLVKINGVESFLLSNGQPITDPQQIATVLRNYQISSVMPAQGDWDKIKAEVLSFNASRNYKTRFGPAETVCKDAILISMYPCDTYASCTKTSTMICSIDPSVLCPPPEIMAPPILNYSLAVNTFDSETNNLISLWKGLSADNAATTFTQMGTSIAKLKATAGTVSQSKLRFPDSGDKCGDCIGRCPASKFDTASLDKAAASIATFKANAATLDSVTGIATQIAQATSDRTSYQKSSTLVAEWGPKWKDFKAKYENLRVAATSVAPYDADSTFTSAYNTFNSKWADMDRKISTREFSNIDSSYTAAATAATALNATLGGAMVPYNRTVAAQNKIGDLLLQARWKANPASKDSVAGYNSLASRKNALDSQFKPPLTTEKYLALEANYTALAQDARNYLSSQQKVTDSVSEAGGSFGSASINGVFTLAAAVAPLSYSTRSSLAPIIPPVVLFLSDLAIVSVAVVIFVGIMIYFRRFFHNKAVLGLWILGLAAFMFALAIGSIAVFAFVASAANQGTFDEFLPQVAKAQTAYIGIDLFGATPAQAQAMKLCADNIRSQLSSMYKHGSEQFVYSGGVCAWSNSTGNATVNKNACFDKTVGAPLFLLHASNKTSDPKFSTVYNYQVDVYGDEAYFKRCEIGDVLG